MDGGQNNDASYAVVLVKVCDKFSTHSLLAKKFNSSICFLGNGKKFNITNNEKKRPSMSKKILKRNLNE